MSKPEERRKWWIEAPDEYPEDEYNYAFKAEPVHYSVPVIELRPGDVILSRAEAEEMRRLLNYCLEEDAIVHALSAREILEAAMRGQDGEG